MIRPVKRSRYETPLPLVTSAAEAAAAALEAEGDLPVPRWQVLAPLVRGYDPQRHELLRGEVATVEAVAMWAVRLGTPDRVRSILGGEALRDVRAAWGVVGGVGVRIETDLR